MHNINFITLPLYLCWYETSKSWNSCHCRGTYQSVG